MNILITGGAGFIGRNLVKKLVKTENSITVIDDFSNGSIENIKEFMSLSNFSFFEMGIEDKKYINTIFDLKKFDICFHLAARINVQDSIDDPYDTFNSDVVGTMNVLEGCRKNNTKFVFMSTCMVYEKATNESGISENHRTKPASPYAGSKIASENLALSYYYTYNLPVAIIRPFNTYGPYQKSNGEGGVVSIFIDRVKKMQDIDIYGDGLQTRDLLYVDDCVDFIISAGFSDKSNGEIINAGLGEDISINDLADMISGGKVNINHIKHIHPQSEIMKLKCDSKKAKELLNWKPKFALHEGINSMKEWINLLENGGKYE
ncbi:dTDP-glucose 4,6-dehydratase [Helicovermis profundi]|uniref:SDR family NAD(P)-dependent oxidoreductase n=1 Tax=Helicovermis profundi TaxID=3065157 RepID=A0AAU9EFC1_9FIRM|nr:SDR family NAD(P)-dependent oxidoreductase [Clostridia bacterium S502]